MDEGVQTATQEGGSLIGGANTQTTTEGTQATETQTTSQESSLIGGATTENKTEATQTDTTATQATEKKDDKQEEPKTGAPEKYADFKLPEGYVMDTAAAEEATGLFKELNLTQEQAQKLIDYDSKRWQQVQKANEQKFTELTIGWMKETKALPNFEKEKHFMGKAIDQLLTDPTENKEFRQLMNGSVGNHPKMVQFMIKVGKLLAEDVAAEGRGGGTTPKTLGEALYGK